MAKLHNPPSLQWELTPECNHDCVHCYNYWRKDFEKIAGLSKSKTEEEYLTLARKIVELKPVSVTITGGEPLLVFDKIKSSISLLHENRIYLTMNTNAVLLNDEICQFLKGKDVHLFISFPCAEPSICDTITSRKGSFERIVKSLDLVQSYGLDFANNMVVSTKNIDYVEMTIDFLKKRYDTHYISLTRVAKPINSDDSFDEWLLSHEDVNRLLDISVWATKNYDRLTIGTACPYTPCSINSQEAFDLFGYQRICTAGKTNFGIDTDGNFKACPRDSRLYGNILVDTFEEMYERMHEWRDGSFIPEECKSCKELMRCLGGCRVDAIPFTGKSNALDSISDPNNLPLKYTSRPKEHNYDGKKFIFKCSEIQYVSNEDSVRLSRGRRFVIITLKLFDFLREYNSGFTNEELARYFGQDISNVNSVIGRLLSEGIIQVDN